MEARSAGGAITSNAGVLLVRVGLVSGLTREVSRVPIDPRWFASCRHSVASMLCQWVHAMALEYKDLNNHDELRKDPALQAAVDSDRELASSSTPCRFEQRTGRAETVRIHEALVQQFIASLNEPPARLVADFGATNVRVHGKQERKACHGHWRQDCLLPL